MTVIPKRRRPDQNTGLRAPRAREVEDQACEARGPGALHLLRNRDGITRCCGCGATWAALDDAVNAGLRGRGAA